MFHAHKSASAGSVSNFDLAPGTYLVAGGIVERIEVKPIIDIEIVDNGSIVSFVPKTDDGEQWLETNVAYEPWQIMGKTLHVDRRMAGALVEGLFDSGLNVA